MRWNLLLVIGLFLVAGTLVSADPTVGAPVLTYNAVANPAYINPSASFPLSVAFTVMDPTYLAGQSAQIEVVLSVDANIGSDDVIVAFDPTTTLPTSVSCTGTDLVTGLDCTATWNGPATIATGTVYGVVKATINALSEEQGSASTILDNIAPTHTIDVNGTAIPAHSFIAMTNPLIEITATDAGIGIDEGTFKLLIDGADTLVTMTSGAASYTPTLFDGTHTINIIINDTLGNHLDVNQTLKVDTNAPTPVTATATSGFTSDETPDITVNASDASSSGIGMKAYYKCSGGATYTAKDFASGATSLIINDFDITTSAGCTLTDETKTIHVHVADGLGSGASTFTDVSVPIKYDNTPPSLPSGLSHDTVNANDAHLTWSASSDSGSGIQNYLVYRHTSNDSAASSEIGSPTTNSLTITGLAACTPYYFWVKVRDNAGNTSAFSSGDSFTTSCPSSSGDNSGGNSGTSSGGGGGGGGGGNTCNVTLNIPTNVYAGDVYTISASGSSYANGVITVFATGKTTSNISSQSGTAKTEWSGSYTVPSSVGSTLTFRFKSDACISASTLRVIKDPSTKPVVVPTPASTDTNGDTEPTLAKQPDVIPDPFMVTFDLAKIQTLLADSGFNAENTQMRTDIETTLNSWRVTKQVRMVSIEGTDEYTVQLVLSLTNTSNNGTIKIIENVPKAFAQLSTEFEANYPMTVLKEDPLIQFELSNLIEGQALEIILTHKDAMTFEQANEKMNTLKTTAGDPPLLFASGIAQRAPLNGEDGLAGITGFVGAVGGNAVLIVAFLAVVGIIMLSVRMIRTSVAGSDNPILRSSSSVKGNTSSIRAPSSPVRGQKMWKSGEVRLGDDEY